MKNKEDSQKYFGKKTNLVSIVVFSVALTLSAVAICDGYKTNSLNYLFPRVANFRELIPSIVFGVMLVIVIVSSFFWKSKTKKSDIIKMITVLLLCLLLLIVSIWISIWIDFDSYTESLDDYMEFDTEDFPLNELKNYFPNKEKILAYQENGFDVEYTYKFKYPFLAECMEYDIKLSIAFLEQSAFVEHTEELLKNGGSIFETDKKLVIVYRDETLKINGESACVLHKVSVDKESKVVVFCGSLYVQ